MTAPDEHHAIGATGGRHTVRDHATRPRACDGNHWAIATAASVRPVTVHDIVSERLKAAPITAAAQLAAGSADPSRAAAGGTRLRLRALHVMGHGSARIARAAGASEQAIQKITRGQTATVSPGLRDAVAALYDAWWDKRAPERTRAQRAAATAARRRAITGNWCAGAGLDDDQLDIPGYQPAWGWLPARGTGVATDIHLPAPDTQAGIA